jgi:LCP family protein required for cell wall assembly
MASTQTQTSPKLAVGRLNYVVWAAFGVAALLLGYLTFVSVRDFIETWQVTSLPGVSLNASGAPAAQAAGQGLPGDVNGPPLDTNVSLQAPGGPEAPAWDGAKRVTILILGLDARDWQANEGPPRTDTMILMSIDPVNRTAGMMSIPRDLWVNVPGGFKYGRINTAYQIGEAYKYPGGGPALAMATVKELLGVPIDYYAQIDFDAFIKFIDLIEGVKINVPARITIDPLGSGNTYRLRPGWQVLNGELALAYARDRHTQGGDFDRAQRQQQVIMGIRDNVTRPAILPILMAKAPQIYAQLQSGIHTNLNFDTAFKLGWLASQIPPENIKKGIIAPPDQVTFATSPDGSQQVLKPITEKIRALRDQVFAEGNAVSPIVTNMAIADVLKEEGARVAVQNGSVTAGLAAKTAEYLQKQGLNVTETGNAPKAAGTSEIIFYTGKPHTVKFLMDLMKIAPLKIRYASDPNAKVDVVVIVGDDWARSGQMK